MSSTLEKILIIDLESTCDEPRPSWNPEIIEIGLVVFNMATLKVESKHSTFVVPTSTPITKFCTRLTTITPEMVNPASALSFPDAIDWLKKFDPKNKVWASWGDYDRKQFESQCKNEKIPYPFGPNHINVKTLFALFNQMKRGIGTKEAVEMSGLTWTGTHHRGIDDAENISNVFAHILKRGRKQ